MGDHVDAPGRQLGRDGAADAGGRAGAAAGVSGSQLYHYFDSEQALIRAVITRQADSVLQHGQPRIAALDSFDALRAWADAAIERQQENGCRNARCWRF
ncbi:hypothetical protein [Nonomuraea glycinis]|uniref:hypothetical protein n=1 Tax=Nonomuraea glycinis TaxID=2047744 RepID=UPI0033BFB3EC